MSLFSLRPSLRLSVFASMFLVSLSAQGITGIRSGYVFDTQSKSIRPVNGLPGASTLGAPLAFGLNAPFDQVQFTKTGNSAYASINTQIYKLNLDTQTAEPLTNTPADALLVAPGLIWSPSTRQIQFTETNGAQSFVAADGNLTAALLHKSCATLAFDSGTIESICGNTQTQLFNDPTAKITALAPTTTAIYALDSNNNQVRQLGKQDPIASGFQQPVGLATVTDTQLAIADAATQSVTFISLDNSQPTDPISLLFAPTTLRHLASNILQLGEVGANPFEVIDLNQRNRNFFVPAIAKGDN
jgi:hypothetical protein